MFELKPLSEEAIPAALDKAERYRLLNEPAEAESICLDVLKADPDNQKALITLLLAVSDRFGKGYGVSDTQAKEFLVRVRGEYERAYYAGIIGALVFAPHAHQELFRLRVTNTIAFAEAIAHREQKRNQRLLIIGIGFQDIETDALRLGGFIEKAVTLGLVQGCWNRFFREWFQFKHGWAAVKKVKSVTSLK